MAPIQEEGEQHDHHGTKITSPLLQPPEVGDEWEEDSTVEQVALTVPVGDDPETPVLTFRMWVLGTASCVALSFLNAFFGYRREPLTISAISAQVAVVPVGRLMAAALPTTVFFRGRRPWEFTLNPGPFNVKEHVLITIFANAGAGSVFALNVITDVRVFYGQQISFFLSLLLVLTSQVLGFGWAGIFRRYLVEPAAMWWPSNLVQVSLFRALHEKEQRRKGSMTRNQFFMVAFVCSFTYYIFPGYLFQMLTSLSWICWIFPNSVIAQQLGSGLHGLGIGTIGLDWSSISSYLGSPLASPCFATANIASGFFIVIYIITPITYWFNIYNARNFPIYSDGLFTVTGHKYNISSIIDSQFHFDNDAYQKNGPLHISTFFVFTYGLGFASLTATISHVLLFHGREIWQLSKSAFHEKKMDVHTKLMRRYKQVPEWWFICILVTSVAITMFTCEYYIEQLQLPWWGVLLACALSIFCTLPIGIIKATTNQTPALNIISEYIMGYLGCFQRLPEPDAQTNIRIGAYVAFQQAAGFHPAKAARRAKFASAARSPTRASPIFARGPNRFAALRVRERGPLETALYPGRPIANMCFKVYGYIGPRQALEFLQDLKLGHYMKIPPRTMFMAQVCGTLIAATVYLGTTWWLMAAIPNICNTELLSPDSPWTCPMDHIFYDASVIWDLIGPQRIFGNLGIYAAVNWFFLGGAIAPLLVWFAYKAFPAHKWILFVNAPLLIGSTSFMPPAAAVNYNTWILVAFLSGYVVYTYRRDWWERHNYLLSGALDAGLAFMAVLIYLCLGFDLNSLRPCSVTPIQAWIDLDWDPIHIAIQAHEKSRLVPFFPFD